MKIRSDWFGPWRPAFLCTDAVGWHWLRTVRRVNGNGVSYLRQCRSCPYTRGATNAERAACDARLGITVGQGAAVR